MDNIIKELAEQAGIGHRLDNPTEIWGYDKDLEKFAELIVKECVIEILSYSSSIVKSGYLPETLTPKEHEEFGYIKGLDEGFNEAISLMSSVLLTRFGIE